MIKIKSLFVRDFEMKECPAQPILTPGCEWVLNGDGSPYRKLDGTACMVRDGVLYKRFDCKRGRFAKKGFEPCQDPDTVTGHWPGWLPVSKDDPADKWHIVAFDALKVPGYDLKDGTYELIGPPINGNRESVHGVVLENHKRYFISELFIDPKKSVLENFNYLKKYLTENKMEGIVWHHDDGRMVKLKRRDFGVDW